MDPTPGFLLVAPVAVAAYYLIASGVRRLPPTSRTASWLPLRRAAPTL